MYAKNNKVMPIIKQMPLEKCRGGKTALFKRHLFNKERIY